MKVRMYNVGFGDCFCLRDRKKSLLVDFGTNNSRIEGRPRREIFDVIISDLSTIKSKNLLLTHFHMDHLSGLLYMMKNRDSSLDFGKIYLPDRVLYLETAAFLTVDASGGSAEGVRASEPSGQPFCTGGCTSGEQTERGTVKQGKIV